MILSISKMEHMCQFEKNRPPMTKALSNIGFKSANLIHNIKFHDLQIKFNSKVIPYI